MPKYKYETIWDGFQMSFSKKGIKKFCKLICKRITAEHDIILKTSLSELLSRVLSNLSKVPHTVATENGETRFIAYRMQFHQAINPHDAEHQQALNTLIKDVIVELPYAHYKFVAYYHGHPNAKAFELGDFYR